MNQVECGRNAVWGGCEECLINSHFQSTGRSDARRPRSRRLYNEYRDQVERAHGLPVTSRTVVLWPRVSVSKV